MLAHPSTHDQTNRKVRLVLKGIAERKVSNSSEDGFNQFSFPDDLLKLASGLLDMKALSARSGSVSEDVASQPMIPAAPPLSPDDVDDEDLASPLLCAPSV